MQSNDEKRNATSCLLDQKWEVDTFHATINQVITISKRERLVRPRLEIIFFLIVPGARTHALKPVGSIDNTNHFIDISTCGGALPTSLYCYTRYHIAIFALYIGWVMQIADDIYYSTLYYTHQRKFNDTALDWLMKKSIYWIAHSIVNAAYTRF